jgi:hypothetical protein
MEAILAEWQGSCQTARAKLDRQRLEIRPFLEAWGGRPDGGTPPPGNFYTTDRVGLAPGADPE